MISVKIMKSCFQTAISRVVIIVYTLNTIYTLSHGLKPCFLNEFLITHSHWIHIATWTKIVFLKRVHYYTHSHQTHIATCTEIVFLKQVSYYTLSLYTHCHMDWNHVFKTSSLLHTRSVYTLPHGLKLCF